MTTKVSDKGKKRVVKAEEKKEKDEPVKKGTGSIDVMLAQSYNQDKHDPSDWLMSEKLDGIRCYWDGACMYSRVGNIIYAPKEWKEQLPKIALDGELWSSRDEFQSIVSIVKRKTPDSENWKQIKFMVFDGPLIKGTFAERLEVLKKEIDRAKSVNCVMVKQTVCKNREHLLTLMDEICGGKGEGVMIKDPASSYEKRRSWNLLKVKRFEDAEATVYDHQAGTGRISNLCGAILVREKDGTEFKIGSGFSDAQRKHPPKKGAVVTFKFQGRSTSGVPRFPTFMREHPGM